MEKDHEKLKKDLRKIADVVLFLISGGGSSLFELPDERVTLKEIVEITEQLLKRESNIVETNAIRKRLSKVKAREIYYSNTNNQIIRKLAAIIVGGESVVHVNGNGKGGRNQELALAFAIKIEGQKGIALFGTDGTDGPTDAAGGIVDGETYQKIRKLGLLHVYLTIH